MALQAQLYDLIARLAPASLLWVAGDDFPAPPEGPATVTRIRQLANLPADRIHDLAVVDSAAPIPDSEVPILLSKLRDLSARRVLVVARPGADAAWSRKAMIAYGYTAYGSGELGADRVLLYQFDIATYKTTPDWLGPKHWAHPERWDQERW
jgi:hypothetical protein